jgi:hypothetical protein
MHSEERAENGDLVFTGPLNVPIAGRTDHIPLSVPAGSYVIPADVVSGLGEGNTLAGQAVLSRMFPNSRPDAPQTGFDGPPPAFLNNGVAGAMARGGKARAAPGSTVPVIVAGGEFIVHPKDVAAKGGGNLNHGHSILDAFVKLSRRKTIKDVSKLPGPKKG